ncbi:hypothetical protein P7C71_g5999, partial [Lecanoromycetidae sp. Uapishka_2]
MASCHWHRCKINDCSKEGFHTAHHVQVVDEISRERYWYTKAELARQFRELSEEVSDDDSDADENSEIDSGGDAEQNSGIDSYDSDTEDVEVTSDNSDTDESIEVDSDSDTDQGREREDGEDDDEEDEETEQREEEIDANDDSDSSEEDDEEAAVSEKTHRQGMSIRRSTRSPVPPPPKGLSKRQHRLPELARQQRVSQGLEYMMSGALQDSDIERVEDGQNSIDHEEDSQEDSDGADEDRDDENDQNASRGALSAVNRVAYHGYNLGNERISQPEASNSRIGGGIQGGRIHAQRPNIAVERGDGENHVQYQGRDGSVENGNVEDTPSENHTHEDGDRRRDNRHGPTARDRTGTGTSLSVFLEPPKRSQDRDSRHPLLPDIAPSSPLQIYTFSPGRTGASDPIRRDDDGSESIPSVEPVATTVSRFANQALIEPASVTHGMQARSNTKESHEHEADPNETDGSSSSESCSSSSSPVERGHKATQGSDEDEDEDDAASNTEVEIIESYRRPRGSIAAPADVIQEATNDWGEASQRRARSASRHERSRRSIAAPADVIQEATNDWGEASQRRARSASRHERSRRSIGAAAAVIQDTANNLGEASQTKRRARSASPGDGSIILSNANPPFLNNRDVVTNANSANREQNLPPPHLNPHRYFFDGPLPNHVV